jgi:hypothetical protein
MNKLNYYYDGDILNYTLIPFDASEEFVRVEKEYIDAYLENYEAMKYIIESKINGTPIEQSVLETFN